MKKVLLLALLALGAVITVSADEPSLWARYLGSMSGKAFPIMFLGKAQDGEVVSKTGIYLYQGEKHPMVGVIQGKWDSWRSTLKGRWREFEWIGDDLSDVYGGDAVLVLNESGIVGFRKVDGDDTAYDFKVGSPPIEPDSEEKGMFIRAFLSYVAWQKSHS